jgi:hypothetical protein
VREAHALAVQLQHAPAHRPLQVRGCVTTRRREERHGRLRERGRAENEHPPPRRQPRDPIANELAEIARNRERLPRGRPRAAPLQLAPELEREERIPLAHLGHSHQHRARKVEPEASPQQLVERSQRQRREGDAQQPIVSERALELERKRPTRGTAHRREQANRLGLQPPQREPQRAAR